MIICTGFKNENGELVAITGEEFDNLPLDEIDHDIAYHMTTKSHYTVLDKHMLNIMDKWTKHIRYVFWSYDLPKKRSKKANVYISFDLFYEGLTPVIEETIAGEMYSLGVSMDVNGKMIDKEYI